MVGGHHSGVGRRNFIAVDAVGERDDRRHSVHQFLCFGRRGLAGVRQFELGGLDFVEAPDIGFGAYNRIDQPAALPGLGVVKDPDP